MKENKDKIIIIVVIILAVSILIFSKVRENASQKKYYIVKNNDNSITSIYVGDRDIIDKYYSEFIAATLYDKKSSYEMLDEEYRKRVSYSEYEEILRRLSESNYYDDEIKEYRVDEEREYRVYLIRTKNGNEYAFKEKSIMNYTVYLDFKDLK